MTAQDLYPGGFFDNPKKRRDSFHHKSIECGEFTGDCAEEFYIKNIYFEFETNIVLSIVGFVLMANIPAI